jgi:hypothetical protein
MYIPPDSIVEHDLKIVCATAKTAAQAEWTKVSETDSYIRYLDISTIKQTPNGYQVWVMLDIKNSSLKIKSKKLEEYDCKEERVRFHQGTYSSTIVNKTVAVNDPSEWQYIMPGDDIEISLHILCDRAN